MPFILQMVANFSVVGYHLLTAVADHTLKIMVCVDVVEFIPITYGHLEVKIQLAHTCIFHQMYPRRRAEGDKGYMYVRGRNAH